MIIICDCGRLVSHSFAAQEVNALIVIDTKKATDNSNGHVYLDITCPHCRLTLVHVVNGLPEHDQAPDTVDSPHGVRFNVLKHLPPKGTAS